MHRSLLLGLLERYAPLDAADAAQCARVTDFVRRQPRCFDRSLESGHVTGSAWIVDRGGGRVLLTHHRKLNIWVQPGGHADGDPDVAAVARREAAEETGLPALRELDGGIFDVDVHRIPISGPVPAHDHYDIRFALQAAATEEFLVSAESHALAWVPLAELERYTREPSLLRMCEKWRHRCAGAKARAAQDT